MNAFAALSDTTRREIVRLIAQKGELTSTEISHNFKMSPPAISQHLKILKEANVLVMRKNAQKRIYSFNETGTQEMEQWLIDTKNMWNNRLDKMEKYLLKLKKERANDEKK